MTSPVTIDKLAFGGNGVCRIDGKVCFVPYSCPGDSVSLLVTRQKKSYCTAEIAEILQPSADRVVPLCPIFGVCGGCSWQHINYPVQLEQKTQIFAETLWRGARVDADLIIPAVASPLEYGYRGRVQFKVSATYGNLSIGFYRNGTHEVVDAVNGCPVAKPIINEIIKCFRTVLADFDGVEFIDQISIDIGELGAVAIISYTGKDSAGIRAFLAGRSIDLGLCSGVFLRTGHRHMLEKLWGIEEVSYSMPNSDPEQAPLLLSYLPGNFAQVNQIQNVAILSIIRHLADFNSTEKLLDLYCGNGNFSIPLAANASTVLGIEGSSDSILSAKSNKARNGVQNVKFICDDVNNALQSLIRDGRSFDVVLLDPPRAGAGDAVSDIVRLNPDKIVYVSCDPSTLARDCGLFAGHGYRVIKSVPLDMFPQTYHLESVTLLLKQERL